MFFTYLLESYADARGLSAAEVYRRLKERGKVEFVQDMYELYHVEAIENAFRDFDSLIAKGDVAF